MGELYWALIVVLWVVVFPFCTGCFCHEHFLDDDEVEENEALLVEAA